MVAPGLLAAHLALSLLLSPSLPSLIMCSLPLQSMLVTPCSLPSLFFGLPFPNLHEECEALTPVRAARPGAPRCASAQRRSRGRWWPSSSAASSPSSAPAPAPAPAPTAPAPAAVIRSYPRIGPGSCSRSRMTRKVVLKGAEGRVRIWLMAVALTRSLGKRSTGIYQIREANQVIEEFMLAANVSVAEKILKHYPLCSLLRRHPSPTKEMLEPLLHTASSVGLNLDVSSSKALAESLDNAKRDDPYFNKLIRIMATRCMTQAVYFCSGDLSLSEYYHYGLASALYTHFTSPIRRYADVVVHRLLAAALDIAKLPPVFQDGPQLTGIADNLNYRHRNAQMASRASVELHTLIYFRTRPIDTEARIVKIKANGFIVFVPKFGIEGPIYLTAKGDKGADWVVDEAHQRVTKPGTNISYAVLQSVMIHMEVVEPQPHRPKLQLTLI